MSVVSDKVKTVMPLLLRHIPDAQERIVVLGHIVAAELHAAKATPDEVTQFLLSITHMIDGHR